MTAAALAVSGFALFATSGVAGAVTVPAGWKTVQYQEGSISVSVAVPSSWPVERWRANCGSPTPVVFLGPAGAQPNCASNEYSAVVTLGAKGPTGTHLWTEQITNGFKVANTRDEETIRGKGTFSREWAMSGGVIVSAFVGDGAFPGGAPGRAREIIGTFIRSGRSGGGGHLG